MQRAATTKNGERVADWRVLADRSVDTEDEVVYASATYLSTFALAPVE